MIHSCQMDLFLQLWCQRMTTKPFVIYEYDDLTPGVSNNMLKHRGGTRIEAPLWPMSY